MDESHEPEALIDMRTHLTVIALAVAQLRRHGDTPYVERLCALADTAIQELKADIADVQEMLVHGEESREESRGAHRRLRQSLAADAYDQETGPLSLPTHSTHVRTSIRSAHGGRSSSRPHAEDAERGKT